MEGGLKVVSDIVDHKGWEKPFWLVLGEFKLQIPRNKYFDLAFGAGFYYIYPSSAYIIVSKDLSKIFTLYSSGEILGGLYSNFQRENETGFFPKLSLGSGINFHKNLSAIVEIER